MITNSSIFNVLGLIYSVFAGIYKNTGRPKKAKFMDYLISIAFFGGIWFGLNVISVPLGLITMGSVWVSFLIIDTLGTIVFILFFKYGNKEIISSRNQLLAAAIIAISASVVIVSGVTLGGSMGVEVNEAGYFSFIIAVIVWQVLMTPYLINLKRHPLYSSSAELIEVEQKNLGQKLEDFMN